MYFYGTETDICFIESIFSGNDLQKVYMQLYLLSRLVATTVH